jgi:protein-ribulosamine 3-kinase
MALPNELTGFLETNLSIKIISAMPVSGGSINAVYCLRTTKGKYLLKLNNRDKFPGMFKCEAEGLRAIAKTNTIAVPGIVLQDDVDDKCFLLLEWIETRRPTAKASALLGQQLARMHQATAGSFGFDSDNYMGSLKQSNKKNGSWSEFFIQDRLMPMVKTGIDKELLNRTDTANFEQLYKKLPELFSEEPSSLIHGDLWSGNYLISEDEKPYLIDPAVSYGHREFDIAMTTLFGGFSNEFYAAYNEAFPLEKGWQQRMDLWNLYPLLVHLNLFGMGYLGQVRDCLNEYK